MSDKTPGQVITFYSYKGGTGRTMALANVACLLAQRQPGGRVLMVDWDLEAPGLHRYFRNKRLPRGAEDPDDDKPGLIDLFYKLDETTDALLEKAKSSSETESGAAGMDSEALAHATLDEVKLDDYILKTEVGSLYLIRAGRFDRKNPELYSARVNTFPWEALYKKSPKLIRVLAERLAEQYQYVFIDSRTGITDISGICTMLLPEKLVVVITPNRQSRLGGLKLIERVTTYRRESSDLRPLVVFPLVSRVEMSKDKLREQWRFGNGEMVGYQPEFERLLKKIYNLESISLDDYFDEMLIQQTPDYAYGEEIAVLEGKIEDKFSVRRSYVNFTAKLVDSRAPWASNGETKGLPRQRPSFLDALRQRAAPVFSYFAGNPARMAATALIVLLVLAVTVIAQLYSTARVVGDARQQLRLAQQESARLTEELDQSQAKLEELRDPLKALNEREETIKQREQAIKDLYDQLASISSERDRASQDALNATGRLSLALKAEQAARRQAEQASLALAEANQARREAELVARASERQFLAAVSARKEAENARNEAQRKYNELLAKCR